MISLLPQLSNEIKSGGVDSDDPLQSFVYESSQRICRVLEEDFVQFLPAMLPHLLNEFQTSPQELNEDDDNGNFFISLGEWIYQAFLFFTPVELLDSLVKIYVAV